MPSKRISTLNFFTLRTIDAKSLAYGQAFNLSGHSAQDFSFFPPVGDHPCRHLQNVRPARDNYLASRLRTFCKGLSYTSMTMPKIDQKGTFLNQGRRRGGVIVPNFVVPRTVPLLEHSVTVSGHRWDR